MSTDAKQHSVSHAPSAAGLWVNCPQSTRIIATTNANGNNEAAKIGSAAHEVAEKILLSYRTDELLTTSPFVGYRASNGVVLNAKDIQAINIYITEMLKLLNNTGGLAKFHVEQRVDISVVHSQCFGTCDFHLYDEKTQTLYVVDYKHGVVPVTAEDNAQLMLYLIGLLQKYPDARNYQLMIVQPNVITGDVVKTWNVDNATVQRWYHTLKVAADAVDDPDAPCKTGKHCLNCDGIVYCPAITQTVVNSLFEVSYINDPETSVDCMIRKLELYRTQKKLVDKLVNQLTDELTVMASERVIPGYTLTATKSNRVWKNDVDVSVVSALSGVDLVEQKPVSPAEAERRGLDQKLIDQFTTRKDTGVKLVSLDENKASEVFKNGC